MYSFTVVVDDADASVIVKFAANTLLNFLIIFGSNDMEVVAEVFVVVLY